MEKPETRFSRLLHSKLDASIYFEKMSNPYRRGTPDFYYEGDSSILWAEHKWIKEPWKKDLQSSQICSTSSWTHQRHWLERAHSKGKHTRVIVGVSSGKEAKSYLLEWPYSFSIANNPLLSLGEVRQEIFNLVAVSIVDRLANLKTEILKNNETRPFKKRSSYRRILGAPAGNN